MNQSADDKTTARAARTAKARPSKPPVLEEPKLAGEEIGAFLTAITWAPRQWHVATQPIRTRYSLRPRGPWILGLVYSGKVVFPSDLAKFFKCSPSLITGELNRLIEAGLVTSRKHEPDARQLVLTLTPAGEDVTRQIGSAILEMVQERLSGYTREEILLCVRLLRDFSGN